MFIISYRYFSWFFLLKTEIVKLCTQSFRVDTVSHDGALKQGTVVSL